MPNTCPDVGDGGTTHGGSVSADETWTAAASPHLLPYDTSVYARLTIEPCAVVRIAAGKTVTVNASGTLTTLGEDGKPVTIGAYPDAGHWASIRFIGGTGRLSYTTIDRGGDPLNSVPDFQGALDIRSSKTSLTAPDPVLYVNNVTISNSKSQGVWASTGGGFTADSTGLTITGSAAHAATFHPNLLGTLPPGTYSGNAQNDIMMTDDIPGQFKWDVTLHDRGIPYYSGGINQAGVNSVGAVSGTVVLTIEPGVVWKFKKGTGLLNVDMSGTPSRGVLVARGTAARPIVFTSAEASPAAGDWLGIWMGGDDARNALDYVRIEYAGKLQASSGSNSCQSLQQGTTHNGGALRVYHSPPATLITNSTFKAIATNAIDRGWRDDLMPSLLATNTFTDVTLCNETYPRNTNGACPANPAPCAK